MGHLHDIVVAVDFDPTARAALVRAQTLARHEGARLHLVHGIGGSRAATAPEAAGLPAVWDAARENAAQELAKLHAELEAQGLPATSRVSELGPVHAVLAAVESYRADLVVTGTHAYTGLKHLLAGSVAECVLREASCPVWTVRENASEAAGAIRRVVVATALDGNADAATAWAFAFAAAFGAVVELVHAFSFTAKAFPHTEAWRAEVDAGERDAAERLRAAYQRYGGTEEPPRTRVLRGDSPAVLVTRHAQEVGAHLIVLGTHGYRGLQHAILGSVAEQTLRLAQCSVATVKAEAPL